MPLGVPDVQVFLTEARSNKKRVPCLTATKKGLKTLLSFYITKSVNARVCKRKRVDFLALFMYLWFGVHNYFLLVLLCEKVMLDLICLFFHTSLLTNTFDNKLGFNFIQWKKNLFFGKYTFSNIAINFIESYHKNMSYLKKRGKY